MPITIGTFNVNNLFSRYNFRLLAEAPNLAPGQVTIEQIKTVVNEVERKQINYRGIAMHRKSPAERQQIAERVTRMNLDVLCLQEVEDIDTLSYFADVELKGLYPYKMLIEGNDPRLIDVAVLSKLPIGPSTTWKTTVNAGMPDQPIFSRDMLQATILAADRSRTLLTVFVNHLKSQFVPYYEDQTAGTAAANQRRSLQAQSAAAILQRITTKNTPYVVLGDMNDDVTSPHLASLTEDSALSLVNALLHARESRPAPATVADLPASPLWTHRFKPTGRPARYELFDQIWLSPDLATRLVAATIERRTKMGGDGSDHDPAWIALDI